MASQESAGNHPPYPQMILEAIEALNEKNGSNKTTILRYIEEQYNDLPEDHTTLGFNYLTKMKETGELIFWKNNYSKPDPNAPPRCGRGRPPKPKSPNAPGTVLPPAGSGRPRGRPPKDRNAGIGTAISKKFKDGGRPRGRPRKMAKPSGGISGTAALTVSGTRRPRGRPPKVKAQVNEVSVS